MTHSPERSIIVSATSRAIRTPFQVVADHSVQPHPTPLPAETSNNTGQQQGLMQACSLTHAPAHAVSVDIKFMQDLLVKAHTAVLLTKQKQGLFETSFANEQCAQLSEYKNTFNISQWPLHSCNDMRLPGNLLQHLIPALVHLTHHLSFTQLQQSPNLICLMSSSPQTEPSLPSSELLSMCRAHNPQPR